MFRDNINECFHSVKYGQRQAGFISSKAEVIKSSDGNKLSNLSFLVGLSAPYFVYAFQSSKEEDTHFKTLKTDTPGKWTYSSYSII